MSLQWQEVDQSVFETYPSSLKTREPDDLDAVLSAVESGRVVQITVADEGAIRGRRMALGRRAKHRGCPIEMRYQGTSIVVRKAAVEGGAQSMPDEGTVKTDEDGAQEVTRRSRRSKTTA